MYLEQDIIERGIIDSLKNDIMQALSLGWAEYRKDGLDYLSDVYHGII